MMYLPVCLHVSQMSKYFNYESGYTLKYNYSPLPLNCLTTVPIDTKSENRNY